MGDTLQLVELDANNQPVVIKDLNAVVAERGIRLERDTLTITPGAREPRWAQRSGRYGGKRQVGEARDNAAVVATFQVAGGPVATVASDATMADVESLIASIDAPEMTGRWLMFRPEFAGVERSTLFRCQGAGDWRAAYRKNAFAGGNVMAVELTVPVVPKASGLPCDVRENFDSAARWAGDYMRALGELDVGGAPDTAVVRNGGGWLEQVSNLGSANTNGISFRHRRSQKVDSREITFSVVMPTPIGGTGAYLPGVGVWLKLAEDDSAGILAYLWNNQAGSGDLVKVTPFYGGVFRADVATANVGDLAAGTTRWIRARVEGNAITLDVFAGEPGPGSTPLVTATGTLVGTDATNVGAGVAMRSGVFFRADVAGYRLSNIIDRPYTYRSLSSPMTTAAPVLTNLPGDTDGDAAVEVYHRSGNRPRFGLIGWRDYTRQPITSGQRPFGAITSGLMSGGAGTSHTAQGAAEGGVVLEHAVSAAGATEVDFYYDARFDALVGDGFAGDTVPVAVWARSFRLPSTLVTPRMALAVESVVGEPLTRLYSVDGGVSGRGLVLPSSGSPSRFYPVGVILADRNRQANQRVHLLLSYGSGSSGTFDIDYIVLLPLRSQASSPVGKPSAGYPDFFNYPGVNWEKIIATDLSARLRNPSPPLDLGIKSPGLGGARLELPPTDVELTLKTSDLIPDDPAASSASEQLAQTVDVHVAYQPCYRLWRDE